jgi:uncharacterized membrane protein
MRAEAVDLRNPFPPRVILRVLVLLILASPTSVFAQNAIQIQASFNSTQTDQGILVVLSGRVSELSNMSVPNAVISIQVNNPQGTSILVAIRYTDQSGIFQDSFLLPPNSPAGNYTAYLVADKPGYNTAHLTLVFSYSTPDFSIEPSLQALSLQQGQTGSLTVTVLSLRDYNERVNLTAIDPPSGVTLQFNPTSIVPSATATVNVIVSDATHAGNYTVTLLAVSGSLSHRTSFQLEVTPGPLQTNFLLLVAVGIALVLLIALGLMSRSRRRSRQREKVLEELLKQASADTGYVATARVIAHLEELRGMGRIDENTYQRLKREYEKRLEKSK